MRGGRAGVRQNRGRFVKSYGAVADYLPWDVASGARCVSSLIAAANSWH